MNCARCNNELPSYSGKGRPRKFCTRTCADAVYRDSVSKACTHPGCIRLIRARGLCGSHYNQKHYPDRHPKREYVCAACKKTMLKDAGRDNKYKNLYCSDLCKNYHQHGGCSSQLPTGHWARWFEATSAWSPPPPRVVRNDGTCAWCGAANGRSDLAKFCSYQCKKKQYKADRRAREHDAPGSYSWASLVRVWQAFGGICAYCRADLPLDKMQAEHVVPLSRGGDNGMGNILPSCSACNSDKRDLTLTEWSKDRKRRGLPTVVTSWDAADPRYAHLTQWIYLRLTA